MPGLWQPDATRKTLKLSSGGARYAWFAYSMVRQTKGRWGSGYGPDGMLGAPLALESVQLQVISEGLKTKPSQWLDVKLNDKQLYDKIGQWVTSEKFGAIGGPRVYREWYIQTPKKTGKSTLSSSLGLYFTGFDGEPGAEVYTLAAGKGQARTVFDQARQMVLKSPLLMDEFKVWKDVIEHPASGSIFRVLAADADYNEGFHPHCVIIDELHVHKTREMYDAMTSHLHTGAREDPIAIIITNAGDDEESICYEVYSQAKAVIEGRPDAREDLYTWVPELSPDDIYNEAKWSIVMPMSWQTPKMMGEAKKKFPEYVFLRRYLNVWTDAELPWLPYEIWDYAGDKDIVVPKGVPIVVAGDMGMTKDTSALAWAGVIPDCTCKTKGGEDQRDPSEHYEGCRFGEIIVGSHIWGIRQRDRAKDPPCHTLITGDRFPIKLLRNYVEDVLHPQYEILEFVYDKWQMEQLAQELSDEGLNMVEFPQCVAPETLVTLANGEPIPARDLSVGDQVVGKDNEFGEILAVTDQPEADCFRVVGHSGRELVVTGNHPFRVRRNRGNVRREEWVFASDLRVGGRYGDRLVVALDYLGEECRVDPLEAWALGLYFGDGTFSSGRVAMADEKREAFLPTLELLFGGGTMNSAGYIPIGARHWLLSHGLRDQLGYEKRVPSHLLRDGRRTQAAFLAGLIDSDGTVRKPGPSGQVGVSITSTSLGLLRDCQHMFAGLGIASTLRERGMPEQYRRAWDLHIGGRGPVGRLWASLSPHLRHPRKRALIEMTATLKPSKADARTHTDLVVAVESVGRMKTIGLTVSHGTHVTAGLVTHNTDVRMIPASEDLWNVITRDDLLTHPADPVLTKHVMAGVISETGRGWRVDKKRTKKPCDGLIALLMAVHRSVVNFREGAPSFTVLG